MTLVENMNSFDESKKRSIVERGYKYYKVDIKTMMTYGWL